MDRNQLIPAEGILKDMAKRVGLSQEACIDLRPDDSLNGFRVVKNGNKIEISYSRLPYLFRALGIAAENEGDFDISQKPDFDSNGLMLDCSRNAVVKIDTLKDVIVKMALMGHTTLMLYTEDTYQIEGRPYFGYMRGRYTAEELSDLDAFAGSYGIELIPCIQTLAHLRGVLQWDEYGDMLDCADILLAGSDKTYALIEDMIKACRQAFSSEQIHIGMDEAWLLGRGRYQELHKNANGFDIMCEHLRRVIAICEKYGFKPMMWSDMFYHLLTGSGYQDNLQLSEEQKEKLPDDVGLIYWDYYSVEQGIYDSRLRQHLAMGGEVIFAGGAWKWSGYAPALFHSMKVSRLALDACRGKVKRVFVTAWGDNGADASAYTILPVLQLFAEYSFNSSITDAELGARFKTCTGGNMEDFYCMDLPNLPENQSESKVVNPGKYLLFQDVLTGLFDRHVGQNFSSYFGEVSQKLLLCAQNNPEYRYVFETLSALCSVLELKCDIGIKLKEAYDAGDKEALLRYARFDLKEIAKRTEIFKDKMEYQWMQENKPFGFEVQDIRIGGVITRAGSAAKRVEAYVAGALERLEELEEPRLYFDCRHEDKPLSLNWNLWERIVSANVVSGV